MARAEALARVSFLYRCLIRPVEDTRAGGNADHPSQRPAVLSGVWFRTTLAPPFAGSAS